MRLQGRTRWKQEDEGKAGRVEKWDGRDEAVCVGGTKGREGQSGARLGGRSRQPGQGQSGRGGHWAGETNTLEVEVAALFLVSIL